MALDLNDSKAVDYSSELEYFPRNAFGEATLTILSFEETGEAGSETNRSDKEAAIATARLDSFTPHQLPDSVLVSVPKIGETYKLWFQTGGNGITLQNRSYKAAELRGFVSACCGVNDRGFDAMKGKKDMLAEDFSAEDTRVALTRKRGAQVFEKGTKTKTTAGVPKPGEFWNDDKFSAL